MHLGADHPPTRAPGQRPEQGRKEDRQDQFRGDVYRLHPREEQHRGDRDCQQCRPGHTCAITNRSDQDRSKQQTNDRDEDFHALVYYAQAGAAIPAREAGLLALIFLYR